MKYDIIKGRKICFWCDGLIKPRESHLHEKCEEERKNRLEKRKKRIKKPIDIQNYITKRRERTLSQLQGEMQLLHERPEGFTKEYIQGRSKVIQRYL